MLYLKYKTHTLNIYALILKNWDPLRIIDCRFFLHLSSIYKYGAIEINSSSNFADYATHSHTHNVIVYGISISVYLCEHHLHIYASPKYIRMSNEWHVSAPLLINLYAIQCKNMFKSKSTQEDKHGHKYKNMWSVQYI